MKNATKYQKKIKKLLSRMDKSPAEPDGDADPLAVLVESVLAADADDKQVAKALAGLDEEFVDSNELRVSPPKEIADVLGRDYPDRRRKSMELVTALNGIFTRRNTLSFEHVEQMTKRDLRRHLLELGLSPYASACLLLKVFGGHAIPVDQTLVECLEMNGYVEPGSTIEDVQGFLERVILQRHALAAHVFFRQYIVRHARALARKRKAEAEARAVAEAAAKAEAEAAARKAAEAEAAKAKAAKARKAKAAKKARKKAAKARKAARKAAASKTAKRAGASARQAKTAKRAAKRSAKRSVKKARR